MAKIMVMEPDGPYSATLDTGAMAVDVVGAYLGVRFRAEGGRTLIVQERDGGWEITEVIGDTRKSR